MAKIRKGTNQNAHNVGIHLFDPTKGKIEDAKDVAARDNYPFIYIHRTRKVTVKRK